MAPSRRLQSIPVASVMAWVFFQAKPSSSFQIPLALRQLFAYQPISTSSSVSSSDGTRDTKGKRIVFIRHGCTYMNEYLSKQGCHFGDPQFTDIFSSPKEYQKYRDTPLSPRGILQANSLARRLGERHNEHAKLLDQLELVVVSPLTRALQTFELGLLPSLKAGDRSDNIPTILALPHAAERVYLISDIGKPRSELKTQFTMVDFDSGFERKQAEDSWWFTKEHYERSTGKPYIEWRPNTAGQQYACPGEPEDVFEQRMLRLYQWLEARPESTIAVVSHWGVIRWMLNVDFRNCEMRVVPFDQVRPRSLFSQTKLLV